MAAPKSEPTRCIQINTPRSPEEWDRVHTLLKLSLAVAQRVRAEETGAEGEASHDASEE